MGIHEGRFRGTRGLWITGIQANRLGPLGQIRPVTTIVDPCTVRILSMHMVSSLPSISLDAYTHSSRRHLGRPTPTLTLQPTTNHSLVNFMRARCHLRGSVDA
jgi:hypothetical protein